MINIGLFGLDCYSENMGCAALSWAFFCILDDKLKKYDKKANVIIYIVDEDEIKVQPKFESNNIVFSNVTYRFKKYKTVISLMKSIDKLDVCFDFTGGDSFSDIYGIRRFIKGSLVKTYILHRKKMLVLGPQTYGPYYNRFVSFWAKYIIGKANHVFSRDPLSFELVKEMNNLAELSCDVAFGLPFDKSIVSESDKKKIGINLSGLLYSGGYNGNNQFELSVDYKKYCESLLDVLTEKDEYIIYLIPHVICSDYDSCENDQKVIDYFAGLYPTVLKAPVFCTPVEAKSFISHMDVLVGARMHATIAAFSSGIATIPFSYSRKFVGLYEGLNYKYLIDGKTLDTDSAIKKTLEYINMSDRLKIEVTKSMNTVERNLSGFIELVDQIIGNGVT